MSTLIPFVIHYYVHKHNLDMTDSGKNALLLI